MHYDRDGRFQLRYSAPATIGALVEQAVKEAKDALFLQQQGGDGLPRTVRRRDGRVPCGRVERAARTATARPTYADALAEIAHRSLAGVASTSRASHYRVYLHLDTAGAWINNRGAIPTRLVARFLTDGVLQPVWETEGRPVSVGRTMRILPARSRRLIEDRDRGCRFPGCTATRFVEIHHLEEWADGGATDLDNQVSLCPFHHDAIGRGDFTITGDPTRHDGLVVVNRYGHPTAATAVPTTWRHRMGARPTDAREQPRPIDRRPASPLAGTTSRCSPTASSRTPSPRGLRVVRDAAASRDHESGRDRARPVRRLPSLGRVRLTRGHHVGGPRDGSAPRQVRVAQCW